jgi:hypothetical protein
MIRMALRRLFLVPLAALVPFAALAATDFRDIAYLQARIGQVLEREATGVEIEWFNDATGNSGMIRVLRTYFPKPNEPCRDYERTLRQPGAAELVVKGTGCRESSGRWRLKEKEAVPVTATQGGGQQGGSQQGGSQQTAPTPTTLPPPVDVTAPPPEPEVAAPVPEPAPARKKAAAKTKDEDDLIVMPTRSE